MLQKIYENSKQNYECIKCDYVCYTKALITQHIATRKHQNANNATLNICICGKMFKHHSSFSRHRKTCNLINLKDTSNNLIFDVIKQNQEFKDLITEQNKQIIEQNKQLIELVKDKNIIINNSTITNKFNLNLFLNEKCKDALNIADFINSLQVQLIDLYFNYLHIFIY